MHKYGIDVRITHRVKLWSPVTHKIISTRYPFTYEKMNKDFNASDLLNSSTNKNGSQQKIPWSGLFITISNKNESATSQLASWTSTVIIEQSKKHPMLRPPLIGIYPISSPLHLSLGKKSQNKTYNSNWSRYKMHLKNWERHPDHITRDTTPHYWQSLFLNRAVATHKR